MKPKQRAEELVNSFYNDVVTHHTNMSYQSAISCALICVNKIIYQWEYIDTILGDLNGKFDRFNYKYWLQVKKEINKL